MHSSLRLRPRGRVLRGLCGPALIAAAVAAGCGNDTVTPPTQTPPTSVTETFDGTVTVNGATTQPFVVQTAGTVVATLVALDPADATVGLSLGSWNGITCAQGGGALANDNAKAGTAITGSATATGNYCVRVYDVGKLTQATAYQLTITHF